MTLLNPGIQELLIDETTVGAGVTTKQGSILSDALAATLWVDSITSGSLAITVYTLTDEGKEIALFSFPTLTAGTSQLVLKKSGISMQRFLVRSTYGDICSYQVYIRAISNSGESSAKVLGAASWSATQATVTTSPAILIASSLLDRQGLIIKNNNPAAGILYLAESAIAATSANGYPLNPGEALSIDLNSGAEVYAVGSEDVDARIAQAGG